jgi:hypothetical protein
VCLEVELSLLFATPIGVAVEKKEEREMLAGGLAFSYKLSDFFEER